MGTTYADSGVDVKNEASSIQSLVELVKTTFDNQPGLVKDNIGSFANVIDLGFNMGLAIATDGAGTKVLIAQMLNKYDTIAIDMIAMNVNDLICCGAEPKALVDYIALEETSPEIMAEFAKGLVEGANQAGIAIVGGETATLPDVIKGIGDKKGFDIAGTCVGIVQNEKMVTGNDIKEGDVLIGLPSSGFHCNGMSLARKVLDLSSKEMLKELLTPTKIYVKPILNLLPRVKVKGMANITGGGLTNLLRLNKNLGFEITNWPDIHTIFKEIQAAGDIDDQEMYTTFNMGVGFCIVVASEDQEKTLELLKDENPVVIGKAINEHIIKYKEMTFTDL